MMNSKTIKNYIIISSYDINCHNTKYFNNNNLNIKLFEKNELELKYSNILNNFEEIKLNENETKSKCKFCDRKKKEIIAYSSESKEDITNSIYHKCLNHTNINISYELKKQFYKALSLIEAYEIFSKKKI